MSHRPRLANGLIDHLYWRLLVFELPIGAFLSLNHLMTLPPERPENQDTNLIFEKSEEAKRSSIGLYSLTRSLVYAKAVSLRVQTPEEGLNLLNEAQSSLHGIKSITLLPSILAVFLN